MDWKKDFYSAVENLSPRLIVALKQVPQRVMETAREIRLIKDSPPAIVWENGLCKLIGIVTEEDLNQSLYCLCNGAIHAHQQELKAGFISLNGGHRAGVAGTCVYNSGGEVISQNNITTIVLRIAHEIPNAADELLERLKIDEWLTSFLIAGPPGSGKTTMLKSIAGKLSKKYNVVVVDERGEIGEETLGACVLKGYNKAQGIMMAVRSLSPQVIICDEVGQQEDAIAIGWALNCGVSMITTIHAGTYEEIKKREAAKILLKSGAFEKIALISNKPKIGTLVGVKCTDEFNQNDGDILTFPKFHRRGRIYKPVV